MIVEVVDMIVVVVVDKIVVEVVDSFVVEVQVGMIVVEVDKIVEELGMIVVVVELKHIRLHVRRFHNFVHLPCLLVPKLVVPFHLLVHIRHRRQIGHRRIVVEERIRRLESHR
jgi:hypothetical protein